LKNLHTLPDFDVAIVGASIAGCTAAILFARHGLKVALIETRLNKDAYKKICTHYILPCARPTMCRLGLDRRVEDAGGVKNSLAIWTRWGWIPAVDAAKKNYGYNIRRQTLDPILRSLAINAPGVHYMPGWRAAELRRRDGRVSGVSVENSRGEKQSIAAALTVGADGRSSSLVELAGIRTWERPNNRFSCFAFFRNIPSENRKFSRMWLLEPEVGYQFPNDDDTTLIVIMPTKSKLAAFKQNPEECYQRFVESLPEAPNIAAAKPISKVMMNSKNSNLLRGRAPDGMALIGDAAMTSDPLAGVGIGWAFMSAEWLVDCVGSLLRQGKPLAPGLASYRRRFLWELRAHHKTITDISKAGELNPIQKLLFSAATRDPVLTELINDFLARDIGVSRFLSPLSLARAAWVNLKFAINRMKAPPVTESVPTEVRSSAIEKSR
jgi:2-polyprenyl-6-methoxyphenol hydroxylase-like FAD-dependent oxidoreductase